MLCVIRSSKYFLWSSHEKAPKPQWQIPDLLLTLHLLKSYFVVCPSTSIHLLGVTLPTRGVLGSVHGDLPRAHQGSVKTCWPNRATLCWVYQWTGNRGTSELRTAETPLRMCSLLKANLGTHQQFPISSLLVEIRMFPWCSVMQIRDPQSGSDWPCMNPWCCETPWRNPQAGSDQNGVSL